MGCCGQNRDSLRAQTAPQTLRQTMRPPTPAPARPSPDAAHHPPSASDTTVLRYLGRAPLMVRGAVTGRVYAFAPAAPMQPVDERDVPSLSATGGFTEVERSFRT